MYRILVIGPSWIGDTLIAQPFFRLLHEQHPDAVIDLFAPPWTLPLAARMPEISQGIVNPFGHGQLRLTERRNAARELAANRYDHAYVLPNTLKSALIPWFAGIPRRTGYRGEMRYGLLNDVRRLDTGRHPLMVQRYAALALPAGATLPDPLAPPALAVDETARLGTLKTFGLSDRAAVAFCPGAEYGPAKRWPPAHFAELARRLIAQGASAIWLVGSSKDEPVAAEIARLAGSGCINLCGRTTLDQAVDILASAHTVVTNDSGLMHVAAAVGRPLVAVFGSSSPRFTPPLSSRAAVLQLQLPCIPCFKRECPLGHFRCMNDLTPERVAAEVDRMSGGNTM